MDFRPAISQQLLDQYRAYVRSFPTRWKSGKWPEYVNLHSSNLWPDCPLKSVLRDTLRGIEDKNRNLLKADKFGLQACYESLPQGDKLAEELEARSLRAAEEEKGDAVPAVLPSVDHFEQTVARRLFGLSADDIAHVLLKANYSGLVHPRSQKSDPEAKERNPIWHLLEAERLWQEQAFQAGVHGEDECEVVLNFAGLVKHENFVTQEESVAVSKWLFGKVAVPTPDFLFLGEEGVNLPRSTVTEKIFWIESKATSVTRGLAMKSMVDKMEEQFKKYVSAFGPGLVIWRGGFDAEWVESVEGVTHATLRSRRRTV